MMTSSSFFWTPCSFQVNSTVWTVSLNPISFNHSLLLFHYGIPFPIQKTPTLRRLFFLILTFCFSFPTPPRAWRGHVLRSVTSSDLRSLLLHPSDCWGRGVSDLAPSRRPNRCSVFFFFIPCSLPRSRPPLFQGGASSILSRFGRVFFARRLGRPSFFSSALGYDGSRVPLLSPTSRYFRKFYLFP